MEGTGMTEMERWLSLEEIANHLGVSKETIRSWIRKETIPYHKVGRQYKFKASEVDQSSRQDMEQERGLSLIHI